MGKLLIIEESCFESVSAPQTNIELVLCAISKLLTHLPKKWYKHLEANSWDAQKLHSNFNRPSGPWFIDQNMQNIVLKIS